RPAAPLPGVTWQSGLLAPATGAPGNAGSRMAAASAPPGRPPAAIADSVGAWLLTMGIFFSVAGFFHQYYMTEMAPAIAALFGIGLVTMWKDYLQNGWRGWLLPLALVATVAEQIYLLRAYPTWGQWMIPLIVV